MSALLNSFRGFGAGAVSHFVVANSLENSAGGTIVLSLPGIQVGDIAILISGAFAVGSSGDFTSGGTSLGTDSAGSFGGKASWYTVSSSDVTAGGISVTLSTSANLGVAVFRIGASVIDRGFVLDDGTLGSPEPGNGFTKNVASKLCAWGVVGPSGFTSLTNSLGTPLYQSAGKRIMFTSVDPSSLYTNGTAESFSYAPNNYFLSKAYEII